MNTTNRIGICLECGYIKDLKSVNIAEKGILAFLSAREHINDKMVFLRKQTYIKMYKKYYTKSDYFKLVRRFKNFELIKKGQVIGIDGKNKIRAGKHSVILFAHNRKKAGEEGFLLGEKK